MESLGSYLKQRREKLGLSLEEIGQNTRINKKFLAAIENDQPELLPGKAYYRIFTKTFASQLGIAPQELDQELEEIEETAVWKPGNSLSRKGSKHLDLVFIGAGLVLAAVVIFLIGKESELKSQNGTERSIPDTPHLLPLVPLARTDESVPGSTQSDSLELRIESLGKSRAVIVDGLDTLFNGILEKGQVSQWRSCQGFKVFVETPRELQIYLNGKSLSRNLAASHSYLKLEINRNNLADLLEPERKL